MFKRTDPIFGNPRGNAAEVRQWLDGPDAKDVQFIESSENYAGRVGIDPAVLWVQWLHETGDATSPRWNGDLNSGGIGIPAANTPQPFRIETADQAAALHVAALYILVHRKFPDATLIPLWPAATKWLKDVWLPKAKDPKAPRVATVDDLDIRYLASNGDRRATWAWGDTEGDYAPQLVSKAGLVFGADLQDASGGEDPGTGNGNGGTSVGTYKRDELYILIDAGHRSTDRSGNPAEMDRTDEMAEAYVAVFRQAGYRADLVRWWQRDEDGDGDPRWTVGNLNTVALGCAANIRKRLAANPAIKLAVFLSCHFNGSSSPWHGIVADVTGLTTAYSGGAPADDTAANNALDLALMRAIVKHQTDGLGGYPLYQGTLGGGLMSERETGVGLDGYRLALMAATAGLRTRAVRGIIEHGGTGAAAAQRPDFESICARAAVAAVEEVLVTNASDPKPEPTEGHRTKPPVPYVFRRVNDLVCVPMGTEKSGKRVRFPMGTMGREMPDPNALPVGAIESGQSGTAAYSVVGADDEPWVWLVSGSFVKASALIPKLPSGVRAAGVLHDDPEGNLELEGVVDAAGRPTGRLHRAQLEAGAEPDGCGTSVDLSDQGPA